MNKVELLFEAIKNGNLEKVKKLISPSFLSKGVNVNVKNRSGEIPLIVAVKQRKDEIVELLIDKGADINATDRTGLTVLIIAVSANNVDIVELLLKRNVEIDKTDHEGNSALIWSFKEGNYKVADLLLLKDADVKLKARDGMTALSYVIGIEEAVTEEIKTKKRNMIDILISKGVDTNSKNWNGYTALHWAVKNNDIELVKLLLSKDADVNLKCSGHTEYHDYGHADLDSSFMNKDKTALFLAIENQNLEIIKLLLDYADVNSQDGEGRTPLMYAIQRRSLPIVKLFIMNNANVDIFDKRGQTSLHYTSRFSEEDTVDERIQEIGEAIINCNPKLNYQDYSGNTALMDAIRYHNISFAKLLLSKGADVHKENKENETALSLTIAENLREIIGLLIANGADINAVAHFTVWKENEPRWNLFVTPYQYAEFIKDKKLADYLIGKGSDPKPLT